MKKNIWMVGLVTVMATLLVGAAGCNRDKTNKSYKGPYEGTAVLINTETKEVSMKLVHPDNGITMTAKGYVNDKTQVEVNGVTARLEDIHVGDPVKVTGFYEGSGESRKFIVITIAARRPDNNWIKVGQGGAASAPASEQAK